MDRADHRRRNNESRERLRALIDRLGEEGLRRPLGGGWTAGAVFAHLAFWDRWVAARWDRYDRDGVIETLPDGVLDLVNAAGLPLWRALDPGRAAALAVEAAEAVDRRIAALKAEAERYAMATDRPAVLDRSLHRTPHLDELERPVLE